MLQGRIQDLIGGGGPDRDRPKTAILGPQFCRIFGAGASFLVVRGGPGPRAPPWIRSCVREILKLMSFGAKIITICFG